MQPIKILGISRIRSQRNSASKRHSYEHGAQPQGGGHNRRSLGVRQKTVRPFRKYAHSRGQLCLLGAYAHFHEEFYTVRALYEKWKACPLQLINEAMNSSA